MSEAIRFELATHADNDDILALLRDNPMGGRYSVSLEREPNAFASPAPRERQAYVIARNEEGKAVGLCERVVRRAFVNGSVELLPYLTALRVAKTHRNRIHILRGGFRALRDIAAPEEFPCALTSIAADNRVAERVLTAGLKGMPRYRPVGRYRTRVLRARSFRTDPGITPVESEDLPELALFLQRTLSGNQFAPVWTADDLASLSATFLAHRTRGRIDGCISVWDQRSVRQSVVQLYPPVMRRLRTAINLAAPLLRLPSLPPPGATLQHAFLSHLAVDGERPDLLLALVEAALDKARALDIGAGTFGLASGHPAWKTLARRLPGFDYETSLYLVHWPEAEALAEACAGRTPAPDIGLL